MTALRISGRVQDADSGAALPGLYVKAYDKDFLFDDLLGSAHTDRDGRFQLITETEDFRDLFETRPDIYFKVYTPDGKTLLHTTKEGVLWNVATDTEVEIPMRVPRSLRDEPPSQGIQFVDADGGTRDEYDAGEDLAIQVPDLEPGTAYDVVISDATGDLIASRLMTDRHGAIEHTTLWPQAGLEDARTDERLSVEEARRRWAGKELHVEVRQPHPRGRPGGGRPVAQASTRFATESRQPLLLSTDGEERVLNAIVEGGEQAVVATAYNVPFRDRVRVFLVESQQDWREGDPIVPATLRDGGAAVVDADVQDGRLQAPLPTTELLPGAYDLIVRGVRYGYEDEEDLVLRAGDLVTRRATGFVVREDFMASKAVLGGCVNTPPQTKPISGTRVPGRPYYQYIDTFQLGDDVYGALDPAALDPNLVGKMVALYVIEKKTPDQWSMDNSLEHLAELGGNAAVLTFKTQAGCINFNKRLLWPDAGKEGEYEIIADFGNDTGDAMAFDPDDAFDPPLDIIDGYFVAGFRVVPDPATDASFDFAGSFEYNDGPLTVEDDFGSTTFDKKAVVYFPADALGATAPSQISSTGSPYPMVVVVHGNSSNGNSYQGYNYLLEHLAKNGFVAASIHLKPGMQGTGRARALFHHIDALRAKFGSDVANNVGIMGHSRGGEAVAIAARLNQQEGLGHDIRAVISLAPTDQYTNEELGGAWATPYLVVYGSMDGDVAGGSGCPQNTGFALYDRASDEAKSMVFAYGATHGRFNTEWGDVDLGFGKIGPSDHAKLINMDAHQKIARGYMTAFFRQHQRGESKWEGIFQGDWVPKAVQLADGGKVELFVQYEDATRRVVDDFTAPYTATSWQSNDLGGAVGHDGTLPADPKEGLLCSIDAKSPHDTGGLVLHWDDSGDRLRSEIPAAHKDVTAYEAVSLRVAQKAGSPHNPALLDQDLYLTLKDGSGKARSVKVGKFRRIPPPHSRHYDQYTKSSMCTVRVPLHVFSIAVLNTDRVDLSDVQSVTLDFKAKAAGEIDVDSLHFTK